MQKRWLSMKQREKKSSIKKWKMLYFRQMQESSLFSNNATFQWRRVLQNYVFAFHFNESVEVFNPFALVTISKNAWRIVNTCFYQVTKRVKWDNFALRRRKSFFKWFNHADSGAIIIRYISLQQQQQKTIFFLAKEKILLNL